MSVKLLTEHHLEFLSLKGGCTCSSDSTHVKMSHCWKSCVRALMHSQQQEHVDKVKQSSPLIYKITPIQRMRTCLDTRDGEAIGRRREMRHDMCRDQILKF